MISHIKIAQIVLVLALGVFQQCRAESHNISPFEIPLLGFGTWNLDKSNVSAVVEDAIAIGYRHIDCASAYGNEKEVGAGIAAGLRRTGLSRQDIWVTSKLWNDAHAPEDVPKALKRTLSDLGLDYLDLYLMHWPVASSGGTNKIDYVDTYLALTKTNTSEARHIGIANFSPAQLDALLAAAPDAKPYAHQMELHPYLQQPEWVARHAALGVHVTAYSPLGNMNPTYGTARKLAAGKEVPPLLENDVLLAIAERRGCASAAQVALAWGMARGTSVIPKSARAEHILENYDTVGKCKLLEADMKALDVDVAGSYVKRFNNPSSAWGVRLFEGLQDAAAAGDTAKTEL